MYKLANVVVEIILQLCLFMMNYKESLWQVGPNGMTGAWICLSCLGSGTSKSWKLLEHVNCQPVQVVTLVSANDKAKHAAEAERIVSLANQAAKELAKQHTQLEASLKAMSAAKGKGKNKGKTNTQVKAEKFFDKQRTQMANKESAYGASTNPNWCTKVGRIGRCTGT